MALVDHNAPRLLCLSGVSLAKEVCTMVSPFVDQSEDTLLFPSSPISSKGGKKEREERREEEDEGDVEDDKVSGSVFGCA